MNKDKDQLHNIIEFNEKFLSNWRVAYNLWLRNQLSDCTGDFYGLQISRKYRYLQCTCCYLPALRRESLGFLEVWKSVVLATES